MVGVVNARWTPDVVAQRGVSVIGSGSIGVGFAVLFAAAGIPVRLSDADGDALSRARSGIAERMAVLSRYGLLTGKPAGISYHTELGEALRGTCLAQECVPEDVDLKREVFDQLARLSEPDAVLASSSSALVPSAYAAGSPAGERILGAHPANPPYLLPLVELVPGPSTAETIVEAAQTVHGAAGSRTVLVRKEVEGFLFNRLQGAVLREAYCLLRDGVADVADIDEVMRSALGRRWSVTGPFETADLNVRGGIAAHADRMGAAYHRMGAERGQDDPWTPELVAQAHQQRREQLPLDEWENRIAQRDHGLAELRVLNQQKLQDSGRG